MQAQHTATQKPLILVDIITCYTSSLHHYETFTSTTLAPLEEITGIAALFEILLQIATTDGSACY